MTVLKQFDLLEGKRLSELRKDDAKDHDKCSCGRSIRRCTFSQKILKEHDDLTYEVIERKYLDWLCLHGHLLIEHGLDTIKK